MVDRARQERLLVAEAAADMVEPEMRLGLGSGSTAIMFVEALGRRVAEGLSLPPAVATSRATETAARAAGIALLDLTAEDAPLTVDLAVDGADEIDGALRLIKGGGASLLREKIVARMAKRFVVIADWRKSVETLGRFPLPVEIVPFGWRATAHALSEALATTPILRRLEGKPLITDNGNVIVDCALAKITDPVAVAATVAQIPGVVEHGLFLKEAESALLGSMSDVVRMTRAR